MHYSIMLSSIALHMLAVGTAPSGHSATPSWDFAAVLAARRTLLVLLRRESNDGAVAGPHSNEHEPALEV